MRRRGMTDTDTRRHTPQGQFVQAVLVQDRERSVDQLSAHIARCANIGLIAA